MAASLAVVSPVPPQRNGIADYTYELAAALRTHYDFDIIVEQLPGFAPEGVGLLDATQAFRCLPKDVFLYQIGNNPDHAYIIPMLRRWGGVVTLHDLNLYYLYETMGATTKDFVAGMQRVSPALAARYGRDLMSDRLKSVLNYALFDMLFEIVRYSTLIIVHSQFAKARLEAVYGDQVRGRIRVIPHLALTPTMKLPEDLPATNRPDPNELLVLTAGFTGKAKRFDWVVEALDQLATQGVRFHWVHAGEERPDEVPLTAMIQARPNLRTSCTVTGYLSESRLGGYIRDCDIFINLRFPSVGEASGSLSRAMSAARCCVVSDTCAYSELPRDAVVHVPTAGGSADLLTVLQRLVNDAARRKSIGDAARRFSQRAWQPETIAKMYADVIEEAASLPSRRRTPETTVGSERNSELLIIDYQGAELLNLAIAACDSSTLNDVLIRFPSLSDVASAIPGMTGLLVNAMPVSSQIKSCRVVTGRFLRDDQGKDPAGSFYELGSCAGVYIALAA